MQFTGLPGQLFASLRNFYNLLIAVIVIKTGGYSFPGEISTRISSMQPQVGEARARDFIQVRRHDCEMISRWRIDIHKSHSARSQKTDR